MSKAWKRDNLRTGTDEIGRLEHQLRIVRLTAFQYRVEGKIDVYPVRRRYHVLATDERGEIIGDLETFLKKKLGETASPKPAQSHERGLFAGGQFVKGGEKFMSGFPKWDPLWVKYGRKK